MFLRLPHPAPDWSTIRRALSPNPMQTFPYLLPVRDGWSDQDRDITHELRVDLQRFVMKLEAAFRGGGDFPDHALYDWRENGFVLVRAATR
jgi:hypothetical protein